MYTTGITDSGLGFCELGNRKAENGTGYQLSRVTGKYSNVTGRGTSSSKAALPDNERINGKSSLFLIAACTSPIASSNVTI
jgi:hypothetical protein